MHACNNQVKFQVNILNSNRDRVELLTFSTQFELSCSYFQLDMTRLNWKLSQLDLIYQESELDVKRVKYRKFSGFWLLHYLLIESHEEKHEDHLIESHDEKHEEKHDEKHEESHDEEHEEKTWRSFDSNRKSWRENMVESHEENHEDCSIKLFTFI